MMEIHTKFWPPLTARRVRNSGQSTLEKPTSAGCGVVRNKDLNDNRIEYDNDY